MSPSPEIFHKRMSGRIIGTSSADIDETVQWLLNGELVGLPTETVYGLAADATQGEAVAWIYEAKGRPQFNPLISHVHSLGMALEHGIFNATARRLAEAFWPGPLTLVVPFRLGSPVSDLARAGLGSIALRVPSHPVALDVLKAFGRPLAAPSANLSGRISPTTAQDVLSDLGDKVSVVLDGGACAIGVESTVVACINDKIVQLRPGGISRESIEAVVGQKLTQQLPVENPLSPGQLQSHYAPLAPVRMNVRKFEDSDAILAFGPTDLREFYVSNPLVNLSLEGNLRQAAARLFSALRELDAYHPAAIAVAPIPSHGLGEAINDRLFRAAAPRNSSAFDS